MTIKWVQQDPLVMNGEPFCYGSRLTVRQLLELRVERLRPDPDPQRPPGAADRRASPPRTPTRPTIRERYADFFEPDGSLAGPGYTRGRGGRPARPSTGCRASSSRPAREPRPAAAARRFARRCRSATWWYALASTHPENPTANDRHTTEPTPNLPPRPSGAAAEAPAFDPERRATELAILDALRAVVDPEIGMNVVELALIKQILLGPDSTEIKMILTTPFCPYAGSMIAQVKEQAESVVEHDVKVTLLAERWDPRDAGLMW